MNERYGIGDLEVGKIYSVGTSEEHLSAVYDGLHEGKSLRFLSRESRNRIRADYYSIEELINNFYFDGLATFRTKAKPRTYRLTRLARFSEFDRKLRRAGYDQLAPKQKK